MSNYRGSPAPLPPADLRIRLATAFLVVLFLIVAIVPSAIFLRLRIVENNQLDHVNGLVLAAQRIDALMIDQETSERGYLLTNNTGFLAPYDAAQQQIDAAFTQGEAEAHAVGGRAPELFTAVRNTARTWQEEIGQPVVEMVQSGQTAQALALEMSGQGKATFDAFRAANGALTTYAAQVTHDTAQRRDRLLAVLSGVLVAVAICGMVGIGLLYYIAAVSRGYLRRALASEAVARARDEFLALASHEMKTPLATIKGQAQALRRRLERLRERRQDAALFDVEEFQRALERLEAIDRQATRMAHLISEMIDTSRIEGGVLHLHLAPLDIVALTRRVLEQLQPLSPEHPLSLETAQPMITVFGDESRLEQVLTNLINNAVKYSPAGGPVEVTLEVAAGFCICSVRDHGIGIPQGEQLRLFERFYRASNVDAGTISGLGVGLYISRGIVERHGGEIWVKSIEGKGSTFSFSIPLVQPG